MTEISLEKSLPCNLEAEQMVIGAIMLEESVPEGCDPADFYMEAHRRIYSAAVDLFEKGEPVNAFSLKNELQFRNQLEMVGGAAYLASLTNGLPKMALAPQYIRAIKNCAAARRLIQLSNESMTMAYQFEEPVEAMVSRVIAGCDQISGLLEEGQGLKHIGDLIGPVFKTIESRSNHESADAISSGFTDLDRLLSGGFRPQNNIVIAARPGHGKTALLSNMLINMGMKGVPSAFFSIEMGAFEIIERMISQIGEVDGNRLRTGFLNKDDWNKVSSAAGIISELPIYIDDSTNITTAEMRARVRRIRGKVEIKVIGLDYLQLINPPEYMHKNTNEFQQMAAISKSIKFMAKETNTVVLNVSQLSRESEKRKDPRPKLSDLRSSGQIEQDADVVMFVYRAEVNNQTEENVGVGELLISKQRNGPLGDLPIAFLKQYTKFTNLYEEGNY
jgi:replicative DNA helicase